MRPQQGSDPFGAEEHPTAPRLAGPIGIEKKQAARQPGIRSRLIARPLDAADRGAADRQRLCRLCLRRRQQGRLMPGVGVAEDAAPGVEHGVEQRGEALQQALRVKQAVEAGHHRGRLRILEGIAAQGEAGHGSLDGGREALAGDIADDDGNPVGANREGIVEVAPHPGVLNGGMVKGGNLVAAEGLGNGGQDAALQYLGDLPLPLQNRFVARDIAVDFHLPQGAAIFPVDRHAVAPQHAPLPGAAHFPLLLAGRAANRGWPPGLGRGRRGTAFGRRHETSDEGGILAPGGRLAEVEQFHAAAVGVVDGSARAHQQHPAVDAVHDGVEDAVRRLHLEHHAAVLFLQPLTLEGAGHHRQEVNRLDRFDQVGVGAAVEGFDGAFQRGVGGDHHAVGVGADAGDISEQIGAAAIWQVDINQCQVEGAAA